MNQPKDLCPRNLTAVKSYAICYRNEKGLYIYSAGYVEGDIPHLKLTINNLKLSNKDNFYFIASVRSYCEPIEDNK